MVILSIKCDNMYMFKDLELDFTYGRKLKHYLTENDALFEGAKVYVRKNMVLLGGNASGKTTFGKLMCCIFNYLLGRNSLEPDNMECIRFDKNRPSWFEVEIAQQENLFDIRVEFNNTGILHETVKYIVIKSGESINTVRKNLAKVKAVEYSSGKETSSTPYFTSPILFNPEHIHFRNLFARDISYGFLFSEFANHSQIETDNSLVPVEFLNKVLPILDDSVEKVVALNSKDKSVQVKSYSIIFKNGEIVTIPEGNLLGTEQKDRLSHGTYEALLFLNVFYKMKTLINGIVYIDEKMAHIHAELESYLVMRAFVSNERNQIFVTTHNPELLELNLPNNAFLLFKRDADGFNRAFFVDAKMKKNDRNLRTQYENDFFGVLPDYSELDEIFERELND